MGNKTEHILEKVLTQVEKPGRYVGNEFNSIKKDHSKMDVSVCFCYPDTYELGMPFLGYQILYHQVNKEHNLVAERCYAPWFDMEVQMREHKLPLYSLETKTLLKDFDVVGFTLPYELTYTNVLNMLDLSGIPLMTSDRNDSHPIILAGGSSVQNPAPLEAFVDVFLLGDGEDVTVELLQLLAEAKKQNLSRDETLNFIHHPEKGLYVPTLVQDKKSYSVKVHKITELKNDYYPEKPYVPIIGITQDRFAMEIQRGCTEGCRFCQAGMTYRPVRERKPQDMMTQMEATLASTGYEEMSLLSLSTSDYSGLDEYIAMSKPVLDEKNISVSFPSLRLDNISNALFDMAASQRKSGFTFAPEAGSQRLRDVINKNISEENLISAVTKALDNGWKTIKLYYMIGLPTETYEDLDAMANQIQQLHFLSRKYGKTTINVTLSSFIPKPQTPFQWEAQLDPDELQKRIDYLKSKTRFKGVNIKSRNPAYSLIEGILARGDTNISQLIYHAWTLGAKFDAWKDKFNFNIWKEALGKADIDPSAEIAERDPDNPLPWEFVDSGIDKKYLLTERAKAYRSEATKDCRDGCTLCGVCDFKELKMDIYDKDKSVIEPIVKETYISESDTTIQPHSYRLTFSKTGQLRYVAHQDLFRILRRALNVLKLPVNYTQGFNKRPKISMGFPIPMGYDAFSEFVDIEFETSVDNLADSFNSVLPEGLTVKESVQLQEKVQSIMAGTKELHYSARFYESINRDKISQKAEDLFNQENCIVERKHPKKRSKFVDLKPLVSDYSIDDEHVSVRFRVLDSRTGRLDEFLRLLFDGDSPPFLGSRTEVLLNS